MEDRQRAVGGPTIRLTSRNFQFLYVKEARNTRELGEAMNEARQAPVRFTIYGRLGTLVASITFAYLISRVAFKEANVM